MKKILHALSIPLQRGREGKGRSYGDSDLMIMSSTHTLVTMLRPWIRRLTIIISAWRLQTSSKFTWEKVKRQPENGQLLSGC